MNIHVFIDAENVPPTPVIEAYDFLKNEHNVYRCDVVGKLVNLPAMYKKRQGKDFHIQNSDFGKNSADLWLTVEIIRAIFEEPQLELLAIFSNDRDFVPVIDFAVEKRKQVLLLVVESQYKAIYNTLRKMHINRNFVTLATLKVEPSFESIKVAELPVGNREYYRKRYQGKTIFAKRGKQFIELPFIDGMRLDQFTHLMRYYGIWNRKKKPHKAVRELSLSLRDDCVWYQSEQEMLQLGDES